MKLMSVQSYPVLIPLRMLKMMGVLFDNSRLLSLELLHPDYFREMLLYLTEKNVIKAPLEPHTTTPRLFVGGHQEVASIFSSTSRLMVSSVIREHFHMMRRR